MGGVGKRRAWTLTVLPRKFGSLDPQIPRLSQHRFGTGQGPALPDRRHCGGRGGGGAGAAVLRPWAPRRRLLPRGLRRLLLLLLLLPAGRCSARRRRAARLPPDVIRGPLRHSFRSYNVTKKGEKSLAGAAFKEAPGSSGGVRGPQAGWGALTAPPAAQPPARLLPGHPLLRAQSPRRGLAFAFASRGPSGERTGRRRAATGTLGPLPASARRSRHRGRRPELPPPQLRAQHGTPPRGGPSRTPGSPAAHPAAARIPGPGPAAPLLPSVRASVRAAAPGRLP